MPLTFATPPAARLGQLLVLLLLALGLLAGVSVSQSRAVDAQAGHTAVVVVPALQWVHDLADRVDAQRGMAALHLTLHSDAERRALEARLQAGRLQLERQMAAAGQRLVDASDRRHHATVMAGLAGFWAAQDKLLAASRQAALDPGAAAVARALLVGEARLAFEQVRADIQAWWAETERAAAQAASQAHAAAKQVALVVWALALLAALALAAAWALLHLLQLRPLLRQVPGDPALDGAAAQPHLLALNQAVAAARRGAPGRAAGLSAQEAQRLAEQVDAAAGALRRLIDRPAATSASAASAASAADRTDGPPPPR